MADDLKMLKFVNRCYEIGRANQSVEIDPLTKSRKNLREVWGTVSKYLEGKQMERGTPQAQGLRNRVVTNLALALVLTKVPRVTENRPQVTVMARHPFFYPEARAVEALLDWSWDVEEMDLVYERCVSAAIAYRVGMLKVHWDPFADWPYGRPRTDFIMPHFFFASPGASDETDGDWYMHAEPWSLRRVRRMFGDRAAAVKPDVGYDAMDDGLAPHVYGSEGSYKIRNPEQFGGGSTGSGGGGGGVVVKELWATADVMADFGLRGDYWADGGVVTVAGETLLSVRRNPFAREEIEEQDPDGQTYVTGGGHGEFPFVRVVNYDDGTFYGKPSDVEIMIPKNDEYNRSRNQAADYRDICVPYLATQEGALTPELEEDIEMFPGVRITVRPDVPVRQAFALEMPPAPSAEFYQNQRSILEDIQQLTGVHAPYAGKASFAGESGKHAEAMKESSDSRVRRFRRNSEHAIERWARLRLATLAQNMTQDQVFQITTASGQPALFQYSATEIDGVPQFDPQILSAAQQMGIPVVQLSREALKREYRLDASGGSSMPLDPDLRLQRYIQLYAAGVVDEQAVLEQANIPDAPQILQRLQQRRMMEMQMAALGMGKGAGGPQGGGGSANLGVKRPRDNRQVTRDAARSPEGRAVEKARV